MKPGRNTFSFLVAVNPYGLAVAITEGQSLDECARMAYSFAHDNGCTRVQIWFVAMNARGTVQLERLQADGTPNVIV